MQRLNLAAITVRISAACSWVLKIYLDGIVINMAQRVRFLTNAAVMSSNLMII